MKNILILTVAAFVSMQCFGAPRQPQNTPRPVQNMSQPRPAANRPAPSAPKAKSPSPTVRAPSTPKVKAPSPTVRAPSAPKPKVSTPAVRPPAPKPAPRPAPRPVVRRFTPPPPPPRPRVYFYPRIATVHITIVNQPQTIVVQQNAPAIPTSETFAEAVKQELEAIYSIKGVKQAFSIQITVRQLTANKNVLSAEVEALFDVGGKKFGVVAEHAAYNQDELARAIADKIAAAAVVD